MIKRTVEYENYDGVLIKEDFYFNLNRSEITMMEMEEDGGLSEKLQKIVDTKNGKLIMQTFHDLLLRAYGEKSPDGRRFMKSKKISQAFSETPAFDKIFVEFMENPEEALNFLNALIPKVQQQLQGDYKNDLILRGPPGPKGALGPQDKKIDSTLSGESETNHAPA